MAGSDDVDPGRGFGDGVTLSASGLAALLQDAAGTIESLREENDLLRSTADRRTVERDAARRAFNRLEAAISHHKSADRFREDHDDALYHARDRVLRDLGGRT